MQQTRVPLLHGDKDIVKDNYYLFKSCIMSSLFPGVDCSIRFILNKLGCDYTENPDQTCCSGFGYHCDVIPWDTNVTIAARNFALMEAEEKNKNAICVCPTSYGNIKECKEHLDHHENEREAANKILAKFGKEYKGDAQVFHATEAFYAHREKLKEMAKYSLDGLRIATHHGCHYTKIFYSDVATGDWEHPIVLDKIAQVFGATPVDYTEKTLCCGMGFRHTLLNRDYSRTVMLRKLRSMKAKKPDLLLVQCPGCSLNLDYYQKPLTELAGEEFNIPVLNYAQLITLVLGGDPVKDLGIKTHNVNVMPFIEKVHKNKI
ncbi:MAG: CoB--CoM heterodisulfide reductase iron-sulfur subunit B family protein [Actinomycetota bacterium]|nr:CoB--CoM heterodisulfide reductase iron-sulfur subunit B family protein [Actinomycetota bacterium]